MDAFRFLTHLQQKFKAIVFNGDGSVDTSKTRKVHGKVMGHIDPTIGVTVTETGNEILTAYTASNVSSTGGAFGYGFVTLAAGGSVKFASGVTKTATGSITASRLNDTSVVLIYRHLTGSFSYHWQPVGYTPVGDEIIIGVWDDGDFTTTLAGKITTVIEARTPEQQQLLDAAFDADTVDSLHARNATGVNTADPYLPVADGQANPNLNADLLDGRDSEGYAFRANFEDATASNSQVVRSQRLGRDAGHYIITGAELKLLQPALTWAAGGTVDYTLVEPAAGAVWDNKLYTVKLADNTLHDVTHVANADTASSVKWGEVKEKPLARGDGSAGSSTEYITDEDNKKLKAADADNLGGKPASHALYHYISTFNTGSGANDYSNRDAFIQLPGEPIYFMTYNLSRLDRDWNTAGGKVMARYSGLADTPAGYAWGGATDAEAHQIFTLSQTITKIAPYIFQTQTPPPDPGNSVGWFQDANGKYWGVISEGLYDGGQDIMFFALIKY